MLVTDNPLGATLKDLPAKKSMCWKLEEILGLRLMFSSQDRGYTFTARPIAAQICKEKVFFEAFWISYKLNLTYESCYDKSCIEMMLGKGKHRNSNIGEYKVLGQEI